MWAKTLEQNALRLVSMLRLYAMIQAKRWTSGDRPRATGYVLRDGKLHKLGNGKSGRPLQNKLII